MGATPFHHSILEVRLPKHFNKQTDMRYNGSQGPQKNLTAFEARMNLEGSVTTFADITRAFLAQFTTRIAKAKHPINLLRVTQRSGELTRKYLDRFNDECLEIDGLTDSVTNLCLTNGLLNDDFRKHLTIKPVRTMQEIQNVARKYINDEEVSQVMAANKQQPAYHPAHQLGNGKRPKEHSKDGGPTKAFKPFPRVGKFTNYTPLTALIVEVYQQIADKGILSKSRQLKDRIGGNKNLYCDYHKGFSHKTQDYFDLKDALEQAIREGKLAEFSHLIREPKRRDRDRSEDDRSHAMRPRHEPDEDSERDKKDAKILAVSSSSPVPSSRRVSTISYGPEDQWFHDVPENPSMVITAGVET
ncbi:uncharacterized protein LOC107608341 [Arachis ipaensis]|uniref:uncharacterized protein LOC107608341 n=1 Tax=Arachis ipaensis TaxID=130454 RepID=UPI0007AF77AC|nr:uncharacterized protein LOC107608341 [Arachis ipaensis]XP_025628323.1 uncharacterized protein LOC112721478 [Arachis hypogaea]